MIDIKNDATLITYSEMLREVQAHSEYHLAQYQLDISEQISLAMARNNVSNSALAKILGVSRGRISQILSGKSNFTLETMVKISTALSSEIRLTIRPQSWEQVTEFVYSKQSQGYENTGFEFQNHDLIQAGRNCEVNCKDEIDALTTTA